MALEPKPGVARDLVLTFFDIGIGKFRNPAAVGTNEVIVVFTIVEFKDGLPAIKLAACQNAGLFKLRQHPIHGGQSDFDAFTNQHPINILGAQVALARFVEDIQDLQARKRGLQAHVLEVALIIFGLQGLSPDAGRNPVWTKTNRRFWAAFETQPTSDRVNLYDNVFGSLSNRGPAVSKFPQFASRLRVGLAAVAIITALTGCTTSRWGFPYRAGVQQGNWITKDQVANLRPEMTADQVRFALGTPMLASALHANRWDYPYFYRNGNGVVEERTLTVFFDENKKLLRWKGDEQPELQPFQLAREEVGISKREDAQLKLDNTRAINDDGALPIQVIPGMSLEQDSNLMGNSISDPSALPGAPDDAPVSLD